MAEIVNIAKRKRTYGSEVISNLKSALDVAKTNKPPIAMATVFLYNDGTAVHYYSIGPDAFGLLGAIEMMKADVMYELAPAEDEAAE